MTSSAAETIVAIATAPGAGGIAVVRISGPEAHAIARGAFVRTGGVAAPEGRCFGSTTVEELRAMVGRTTYGLWLARPEVGRVPGGDACPSAVIDDVVLSVYAAPHSYTGEDVVEVSCHGSRYLQRRILEECEGAGARLARPGEFTERAFLHGRLDLTQAEAVGDLIAAESAAAHRLARTQLNGALRQEMSALRKVLIDFAALIELENDFGEEDVSFADRPQLLATLQAADRRIARLVDSFETGRAIREGVAVVLAGRPNAGKSTLLNALLAEDRAIVSPIAGTTRDTIDAVLDIDGVRFRISDTAGIREATDDIEALGVGRTMAAVAQSAVLVYVWDVVMTSPAEVAADLATLGREDLSVIGVANKMDLNPYAKLEHYTHTDLTRDTFVPMVAAEGMNLGLLRECLFAVGVGQHAATGDVILSNVRHRTALLAANAALARVAHGVETGLSGDLVALDLRQALHFIGEVTGEISVEDLLESIFSNFCIGK